MFNCKILRLKNFRSYGNTFTEFQLDRNQSTVIVAKNGAGKSSILAGITFALFGKVPGEKKEKLVNDINDKDCVVELECENNGNKILVRRGIKPAIFDIVVNGNAVDQVGIRDQQRYFEESVLGFNLDSFLQVVSISGSTYKPFFRLTAGERRAMVERLLDILVFSKMYATNLANANQTKNDVRDLEASIEKYEASINSLKRGLEEVQSKDADLKEMIDAQIDALMQKQQIAQQKIAEIDLELETIPSAGNKLSSLKESLDKCNKFKTEFSTSKKNATKFIKFLEENSTCPTCTSELTHEFKHVSSKERKDKIDGILNKEAQLDKTIARIKNDIEDIIANENRKTVLLNDKGKFQNAIGIYNSNIKAEKNKLTVSDSTSEVNLRNEIIKQSAVLDSLKQKLLDKLVEKQYNELQSLILKDSGIKSRVIRQIIPKMNVEVNKFLSELELSARFEMDEEFNETIYRRFKDVTNYSNMSAGERTRVDIAILFTWREIAKSKNSLNCNILFLDEIFDSTLDNDGIAVFVKLLKSITDTNVFLISHKSEVISEFENILSLEKKGNFTTIV